METVSYFDHAENELRRCTADESLISSLLTIWREAASVYPAGENHYKRQIERTLRVIKTIKTRQDKDSAQGWVEQKIQETILYIQDEPWRQQN